MHSTDMTRETRLRFIMKWLPLCLVLFFASLLHSAENRYVENFFTKQFKDVSKTTALWDITTGEIKLPPFELNL